MEVHSLMSYLFFLIRLFCLPINSVAAYLLVKHFSRGFLNFLKDILLFFFKYILQFHVPQRILPCVGKFFLLALWNFVIFRCLLVALTYMLLSLSVWCSVFIQLIYCYLLFCIFSGNTCTYEICLVIDANCILALSFCLCHALY